MTLSLIDLWNASWFLCVLNKMKLYCTFEFENVVCDCHMNVMYLVCFFFFFTNVNELRIQFGVTCNEYLDWTLSPCKPCERSLMLPVIQMLCC